MSQKDAVSIPNAKKDLKVPSKILNLNKTIVRQSDPKASEQENLRKAKPTE
ncbi:hypothetical protein [uncultured Flavobacterium sp.]|uniref:hypothetical protein n=1 Tax=uncultured Flavobacterium sp. TaxID=165435 RepID=UPI00292DD47E|nr:hypothetical protein [uncultured Flavobacterium sp.]